MPNLFTEDTYEQAIIELSFGIRLSPGTFSAQGHSTSELLRTL